MAGIKGEYIYDEDGNIIGATGGKLAAQKNIASDPDFYSKIGAKGGSKGRADGVIKGFDANRELARRAGYLGGRISKRGPARKVSNE